jgi:hypothetical protein
MERMSALEHGYLVATYQIEAYSTLMVILIHPVVAIIRTETSSLK